MRNKDSKELESGTLPWSSLPAELHGRFGGHQPAFRVEEFAPKRWWVFDGDVKVGLLTRPEDFVELVNWDPLAPRRDVAFPEIYHAPTAPGDRISMAKSVESKTGTNSTLPSPPPPANAANRPNRQSGRLDVFYGLARCPLAPFHGVQPRRPGVLSAAGA